MGQVSATDFLRIVSQVIFFLVFLLTLAGALRRRTRANLDIALFFGAFGLTIATTWIDRALGISPSPLLMVITTAAVVALPYLLLRLVDDFSRVPVAVRRGAEVGLVAAILGLAVVPVPYPLPFVGFLVLYFVALALYDAAAFVGQSFRAQSVTRRRTQAIALGTLGLGLLILFAGLRLANPNATIDFNMLSQLASVLTAMAYYVGFAPPSWLRRSWQSPLFRAFVRHASKVAGLSDEASVFRELEREAANAVGVPDGIIQIWDPDTDRMRFTVEGQAHSYPVDQTIGGRALRTQKAIFATNLGATNVALNDVYRQTGANAALVAPITSGRRRYGALVVYSPREPIFAEDDLDLVQLLADQIAVVLENRALLEEALTVRARAESLASAEAERNRLYSLFMQAPALIAVTTGPKHVFELVNPMFLQVTGRPDAGALLGKTAREALPELEGQGLFELLDQVYQSGQPYAGNGVPVHIDRRGNGQLDEAYFNFVYTPRVDGHGNVDGMLVHAVEVTEQVRARQALEAKNVEIRELNADLERRVLERTSELRMAMAELESFSYSVSHDLRAPLRTIDGFSLALLEDYAAQLGEEGRDSLHRIRSASQRMGELIDGLLRLSRVTRSDLHWEDVDLSAMARSIVADLQRTEPERKVAVTIENGMVARGDPLLLRVVLDNLLGNAWKFTAKRPDARIAFGHDERDGSAVYVVRDNGAGFDMAFSDKLFGPFQRLHGRTEFEGTGIGLATVQRVIRRHGGRIWGEGEVDRGAAFYFTLGDLAEAPDAAPGTAIPVGIR